MSPQSAGLAVIVAKILFALFMCTIGAYAFTLAFPSWSFGTAFAVAIGINAASKQLDVD